MKKNTIKAFTLVEMLIVIVIIGILIASLMPRMQTAQGRARDVARKNDLSQIETAIITSQADRGAWPGMKGNGDDANGANNAITVNKIKDQLTKSGMSEVPSDPNGSNVNFGLGTTSTETSNDSVTTNLGNKGQYLYLVGKRNGVSNAGFVLMAKTEVEGSSNWVVCQGTDGKKLSTATDIKKEKGYIQSTDDLKDIHLCKTVSPCTTDNCCVSNTDNCLYRYAGELRYILLY